MRPPVVLDTGSGIVKAGFAGEDIPTVRIPNVVGRPARRRGLLQRSKTATDETLKELYVGDDALAMKAKLELIHPIENAKVTHWDEITEVWTHAFNTLEVLPSDQPVFLTEPPYNGRTEREYISEVFFESFEVPALFFQVGAVCSLYAAGRVTGLAVDVGDCVTHTLPVYEGFALRHAMYRSNIGGRQITERLRRLLYGRGYNFSTSAELDSVRGSWSQRDRRERMEERIE